MCGILACVGEWTRDDAQALLRLAAQRGPHGWGVVTAGGPRMVAAGHFRGLPPSPFVTVGALIGHARLATSAAATSLDALQPLTVGPLAIAHNGTVPDADAWDVPWPSGNDSEVLGQWLARQAMPWCDRLAALAVRLTTPYALAVLTPAAEVWVMRRGHPLYVAPGRACSRPFPRAVALTVADRPMRLLA